MKVSERVACRLAGLSRSAYRRALSGDAATDPDRALRAWLRDCAKRHPLWGYRRAYQDARAEGWHVNHKKIQSLWREEGLCVPQRGRLEGLSTSAATAPTAYAPNVVWAIDFQCGVDERGRAIRIASIVDEHTRECIGALVERSITAERLTDHLDDLVRSRDAPAVLRSGNGPDAMSAAMAEWARTRTGVSYVLPGSPWHNGYVESFNSRLRDECLTIHRFDSLFHARDIVASWRHEYNHASRQPALGDLTPAGYARRCTHRVEVDDSHTFPA